MTLDDDLSRVQTIIEALRQAGHADAAGMLSTTIQKLQSAAFCIDSISKGHKGTIADRAHVECAVFFLKAALDATAEAINLKFRLQLVRHPLAASTEDLARSGARVRNRLQSVGKHTLVSDIKTVLDADLYQDLKHLRDRATHRGITRFAFTMDAGGGDDRTYLKNPDGTDRPLPVQDDLRRLLQFAINAVLSWAGQLH